jgi:integrase/recombinase XerD
MPGPSTPQQDPLDRGSCGYEERRGVPHFRVLGKGSKIRYVPVHPAALTAIAAYLAAAGHGEDKKGSLFRPVRNNRTEADGTAPTLEKAITGDGVYKMVKRYATQADVQVEGLCLHALRATAATNALENSADLGFVQEWLGHANVSTASGEARPLHQWPAT